MPGELPVMTDPIPSGLPSELLTRRTDVQEAWLNLLAADADLAAAHKARFPSLSLVGSAGVASAEFSDLLDTDLSVWSITGGLTQPLFQCRPARGDRRTGGRAGTSGGTAIPRAGVPGLC